MLEREIESRLIKPIKRIGGLCLKLECPGYTGVPDRMILLPGGTVVFVETKRPGAVERPRQEYVHSKLRALGFTVFNTVDSTEKIDAIVEDCRRLVNGED